MFCLPSPGKADNILDFEHMTAQNVAGRLVVR